MTAGVAAAMVGLAGCGGSSNLSTDEVTVCAVGACTSPRPAGASQTCSDGSIAGPTCIKHMDGTCGWNILTCPIQRGSMGGKVGSPGGATAVGGQGAGIGSGGRGGTGAGGTGVPTGGVIGSGGYIPTGGVIGSGGYIPTGGIIGSGGYIPTGGTFGSGGWYGSGGSSYGSFAWTGGGSSFSTTGYYEENLAISGSAFIITIAASGYDPFGGGPSCMIVGQFPTVPPPASTYPIGAYDAPGMDGTFVGLCSNFYSGPDYADHSVTGMVVLSDSRPGLIEGSFTMQTRSAFTGSGGVPGAVSMTKYSGAFSVGCRDNKPLTDPACALRTIK
ncbi:MAG TPA: hypothetical protein VIU64_12465 [Polyangia bacterium]